MGQAQPEDVKLEIPIDASDKELDELIAKLEQGLKLKDSQIDEL